MPNHFVAEDPDNKGYYRFGGVKTFGERFPTGIEKPDFGKPKDLDRKGRLNKAYFLDEKTGLIKGANINPSDIGAGTYAILRDPYTWPMKVRFEESYRMDPVVRSAINRKVAFILGKKFDTTFDVIDSFMSPHEARTAINIIASDTEFFKAKRLIDRVMRRCNFTQKLKGTVIQSKVYGRSAMLVEATPEADGGDGFPDNIKILNSKLLGQVRIDEYTWQLQQIQYNTNSRGLNDPYNFLDAADIVYFTNLDYHISPYTIHYGLSDIEPIAHISEVNRILNEEDLKETNVGMWAGYGLIKIPSFRNPAEVQSFLQQFQPGKWSAISQDITVEVHELSGDIGHLINERNENEKLILRALNVPSMILGFEDVQNYATAQEVMLAWKESVIEEERAWINQILEPQWFDTLLAKALNIEDITKLKFKMMLEFEDIAFENLKDKVLAVLPLYEAGLIPADKVLEFLGFDDVVDQLSDLNDIKQKGQQDMQDQQNEAANTNGDKPIPVNYPSMSPKSLLTQVEKGNNPQQQDQQKSPL